MKHPPLLYYCEFTTKLVGNNKRMGFSTRTNRFYSQEVYKKSKKDLVENFEKWKNNKENINNEYPLFKYPVRVFVELSSLQWRGDLDGVLKIILDALVAAEVVYDDRRNFINCITIKTREIKIKPYADFSIVEVWGGGDNEVKKN